MGIQRSRFAWPLSVILGIPLIAWLFAKYVWLARGRLPPPVDCSSLRLPDDTRIAMARLSKNHDHVVVLAHGFLKRKDDRRVLSIATSLLEHFDVILYDQPGHGESTGKAGMDFGQAGACLAEVAQEARRLGYAHVSAAGISLGAAAAINAAAMGAPLDAVVSISSPVGPRWHPVTAWITGLTGFWYQLLGTRVTQTITKCGWPIDSVGDVAPCPLLVVHCGRDTLVSRDATEALFRAAREPKDWLLDEHALHGTPNRSHRQIVSWLMTHARSQPRAEEVYPDGGTGRPDRRCRRGTG